MIFLYNTALSLYTVLINLSAFAGNNKAKLWLEGRKGWKEKIKSLRRNAGKTIWLHCSSLGEFEQGRPLLDTIRKNYPDATIFLTFFSPSGYEIRKNYPSADCVLYLPLDSPENSKSFVELLNPHIVFFIKYDYWYHYLKVLDEKQIPIYIISGIFRKRQHFFQWYGIFFRKMLRRVNHFFLQDQDSGKLLSRIGINSYTVTGDTRFDQVVNTVEKKTEISLLKKFAEESQVWVCGSTWLRDEEIIIQVFSLLKHDGLKLIIAPHVPDEKSIYEISKLFIKNNPGMEFQLYSGATEENLRNVKLLIMDTVGQLSTAYRYGKFAYVGGGFGKGIHNTLEAAAYGIPVIFGPNYAKFREAKGLIEAGAAFSISSIDELAVITETLLKQTTLRDIAGKAALKYVQQNAGATKGIIRFLENEGLLKGR